MPHELTEAAFAEYFAKYGAILHGQIMKDRETGKPRGFGFITFESEDSVEKVLENIKEHKLMGKWVECKKATPSAGKQAPASPKPRKPPTYQDYSTYTNAWTRYSAPYQYDYGQIQYYQAPEKAYSDPYIYEPRVRYPPPQYSYGEELKIPINDPQVYQPTQPYESAFSAAGYQASEIAPQPQKVIAPQLDYAKSFLQPTAFSGFFTEPDTPNMVCAGRIADKASEYVASESEEYLLKMKEKEDDEDLLDHMSIFACLIINHNM